MAKKALTEREKRAKKRKENPFLSDAAIEEREEFERKNMMFKIYIVAGIIGFVILVFVIFYYGTSLQE